MAQKKNIQKKAKKEKVVSKNKLEPSFWKQKDKLVWLAVILVITFIVFTPSLNNQFVNWDDDINLLENENLRAFDGEHIKKIFAPSTGTIIGNYNPLPIFTFAIENAMFGMEDGFIYHLDNLLLHLLCVFLVFRIMLLLGANTITATLAALLYGIHPMRVESVAWVTERKDVLFGVFYWGAFLYYIKYLLGKQKKKSLFYISLALFVAALFSKIQAVALPLSMLAVDYYLKRPLKWKLIWEKIPFFAGSLLFGLAGIFLLDKFGSINQDIATFGFLERLLVGAYSFVVYLVKFVFPYEMSPLYPYPAKLNWMFYVAPIIAIAVLIGGYLAFRKKNRIVVFGLAFFLFNVVFVLQIVGAGQGFLADRFTYVAYFGLFFIAALYFQKLVSDKPAWKTILYGGAIAYLSVFSFMSWQQCKIWKNGGTLWTHVLKYYDKTPLPWGNNGHYLRGIGDYNEALKYYNEAVRLGSKKDEVLNSRGKTLFDMGNAQGALNDYSKAIETNPNKAEYYVNRGAAYGQLGQLQLALADLDSGVALEPDFKNAYLNRSLLHYKLGQYQQAKNDHDSYLRLDPYHAGIWYERAITNRQLGDNQAALSDLNQAISIDPQNSGFFLERAKVHHQFGNKTQAYQDGIRAQQLGANIAPEALEKLRQ